jgi:hypothetical protein
LLLTKTENKRNEEKRVAIYAMGHILNKRKTCSRNFEKRKNGTRQRKSDSHRTTGVFAE